MEHIITKRSYNIIFIILSVAIFIFFIWLLWTSPAVPVDDIWGSKLDCVIIVFLFFALFTSELGIYKSVAYFLFAKKTSFIKTLWNIGRLIFSLVTGTGIVVMCVLLI